MPFCQCCAYTPNVNSARSYPSASLTHPSLDADFPPALLGDPTGRLAVCAWTAKPRIGTVACVSLPLCLTRLLTLLLVTERDRADWWLCYMSLSDFAFSALDSAHLN